MSNIKTFFRGFSVVILASVIILGFTYCTDKPEEKPKTTVVDILPKDQLTEPWGYLKVKESEGTITNPDGTIDQLPVAKAMVTNIRDGKVSDIFKFDARQSHNPISNHTECYWVINGRRISDSKRFDLRLNKEKNYEVMFFIVDSSNPEHPIGATLIFQIPLYDVYVKPSPLDTGIKYDK